MRGGLLISEWLYKALLYLYPKQFRAAYGQQMRLTFRDACRVAYHRNGAGGPLALWLPTLLDLLKSALEERARQGEITMSKTRLIALAGPLTILVGAMWLVASIGWVVLTELGSSEPFFDFLLDLNFFSFVPLLFALIGTRLRFHQAAGGLGKLGLALSVAGCAGMIVVALAITLLERVAPDVDQQPLGIFVGFSLLSLTIGYMLFGVAALRYRLLPRWNLLPLLVGLIILLSYAIGFLPLELECAVIGACWVLLGIALLDQRREVRPTAAI